MPEDLRVGLVGTSWWAETFHLAGLESHPRAQITAICGRDRNRAEQVAGRHGGPTVFTDYDEMIASGLLDAVVISTPDHLHHDMVLRAFASGLHVFSEKPLARTAREARDMLDAAEAAGRVHMVMFTWRWIGIFTHLHQLVADGYLGRCRDARFVLQSSYAHEPTYNWRFDPELGSGIVGDLGSHMIDLARWYVGEIAQVSAQLTTHVARPGADGTALASLNDSASMLVEFADGAQGSIDVSAVRMVGELPNHRVRLYGDEGSLEADLDLVSARLRGIRRHDTSWQELPLPPDPSVAAGAQPPILDLPLLAPLTNLAVGDRLFVDAALDDSRPEPTFLDGWRAQQVVDAAIISDRERCWVSVT